MKIRLWCKKHNNPLENFEESTLIFSPQDTKPGFGGNSPSGVYDLDLSDFRCPEEITDWGVQYIEAFDAWRVIPNGDVSTPVVTGAESGNTAWYASEKDAKRQADKMELDECVAEWEAAMWTEGYTFSPGRGWLTPDAKLEQ